MIYDQARTSNFRLNRRMRLRGLGKISFYPHRSLAYYPHITHPITHFNNRVALKINQNDSTKITNQNLYGKRRGSWWLKVGRGVSGRKEKQILSLRIIYNILCNGHQGEDLYRAM
jgi:hypothetical protein